jgi:inner membrane protein
LDPIAHTLTGAALAAAGLRRATPLAGAALVIGANVPDIDVFASFAGDYEAIAFRRGWTHGVLALVLWPFVLAAVLLAWDRYVRRRRNPDAAPARAGPLLGVAAIAVVTHPTLDWLNNYGLRWLMPFDGRWFYGDALFIVDPWVWLVLGGAAFLTFSRSRVARIRWTIFWVLASTLIFANPELVPLLSAVVWVAGVASVVTARWLFRDAQPVVLERAAQAALAVAAVYIVTMVVSSAAARSEVRAAVAARGIEAESVMVGPAAADPFGGDVVVMTPDEYYAGRFNWLAEPRVVLEGDGMPRPRGAAFAAAARAPAAQRFLVWSRFPVIDVEAAADGGTIVRFSDMRYRDREQLLGPTIRLDAALRVLTD